MAAGVGLDVAITEGTGTDGSGAALGLGTAALDGFELGLGRSTGAGLIVVGGCGFITGSVADGGGLGYNDYT